MFPFCSPVATSAGAVDIKGAPRRTESGIGAAAKGFSKHWIAHFLDPAAYRAYKMDMIPDRPRHEAFVLSRLVAELMAFHQSRFQKKLEGRIYRGAAYVISFEFHRLIEDIRKKMVTGRKYLFKKGETLGCLPHSLAPEIFFQGRTRRRKQLFIFHANIRN